MRSKIYSTVTSYDFEASNQTVTISDIKPYCYREKFYTIYIFINTLEVI